MCQPGAGRPGSVDGGSLADGDDGQVHDPEHCVGVDPSSLEQHAWKPDAEDDTTVLKVGVTHGRQPRTVFKRV